MRFGETADHSPSWRGVCLALQPAGRQSVTELQCAPNTPAWLTSKRGAILAALSRRFAAALLIATMIGGSSAPADQRTLTVYSSLDEDQAKAIADGFLAYDIAALVPIVEGAGGVVTASMAGRRSLPAPFSPVAMTLCTRSFRHGSILHERRRRPCPTRCRRVLPSGRLVALHRSAPLCFRHVDRGCGGQPPYRSPRRHDGSSRSAAILLGAIEACPSGWAMIRILYQFDRV